MCKIRVECYIKYGWDQFIVDPDKNIHSRQKLTTAVHRPGTESYNLLQSLPSQKDVEWTKQLYMLPTITFSTIYDFLVDCKLLLRKVSYIENALDSIEDAPIGKDSLQSSDTLSNVTDNPRVKNESWYESVEYTRSLDKAY